MSPGDAEPHHCENKMSSIGYALNRFSELTRQHGPRETLLRIGRRAVADTTLYSQQIWWQAVGQQPPSAQKMFGQLDQQWKTIGEFVDFLAQKDAPAYLFAATEKDARVAQWQNLYSEQVETTLAQAETIFSGRIRMLGTTYDFGQGVIDWHLDAGSGQQWPLDFVAKIDRWFWTDQRPGDYKPLWELNRQQYLTTLGKAYWLTGDGKYARLGAEHILSWIQANPCPFGINWYSALEIGVRLIAWGLALHFFRSSSTFRQMAGQALVPSFYQQAHYLRQHLTLEWPGRNNHIIGEAAALAFAGAFFAEFAEAGEWLETGLNIVEAEVTRQTHADGVNREQSPAYHRFVLDFVLLLIVLARRGAIRPLPTLETHAEKMLNYLMYALTPDGRLPRLGDDDDGWAFQLGAGSIHDTSRETLAIGAALYGRSDFKYAARTFGEGAFWLLGEAGWQTFSELAARPPQKTTSFFPQAGQIIIRSSWQTDSDYGLLRCGAFGLAGDGYCAHAHCDLLSPVLWLNGRPLLIDSGTYTYHGPWRDRFQLTAAHNSVLIDGQEQAVRGDVFSWQQVPTAACKSWTDGCVMGCLSDQSGVVWRRELAMRRPGAWVITDQFAGNGRHHLEWYFHLAPEWECATPLADHTLHLVNSAQPELAVKIQTPDVVVALETGWVSYEYGRKLTNQVIHAYWEGDLTAQEACFSWLFNLNKERAE